MVDVWANSERGRERWAGRRDRGNCMPWLEQPTMEAPVRTEMGNHGRGIECPDRMFVAFHDQRARYGHGDGASPFGFQTSWWALVDGEERTRRSNVNLDVIRWNESSAMKKNDHVVFIVDDDERIREALTELLESHGIRAVAYGSASEYVQADKPDLPASLILDVELPDINGLDLQKQIAEGYHPPIVFITGHGDIPSSVRAIKRGAVDFLTKPISEVDLMRAVRTGLAQDRQARLDRVESAALRERYSTLTPREREVLPLVVSGLLNKQAAAKLGISEVMLQIHRRNAMQKMAAASLADLVRMAEKLQIPIKHSRRSESEEP
jgi:FixJ family two-component response regulator